MLTLLSKHLQRTATFKELKFSNTNLGEKQNRLNKNTVFLKISGNYPFVCTLKQTIIFKNPPQV